MGLDLVRAAISNCRRRDCFPDGQRPAAAARLREQIGVVVCRSK